MTAEPRHEEEQSARKPRTSPCDPEALCRRFNHDGGAHGKRSASEATRENMLDVALAMALWPWQRSAHVVYCQTQQVSQGTRSHVTWIPIPAPPRVSCVTLDTCRDLSGSQLRICAAGLPWPPVSCDCYDDESVYNKRQVPPPGVGQRFTRDSQHDSGPA